MPECDFSETQFSFCYTFEFIEKYCPWGTLPLFPSTYIEGQPGYGYDVKVSQHLYFQFKRPFLVSRRRKPNFPQWDTYKKPYLRAHIDTNAEQYNLLKQLKTYQNEVFYITPEFCEQDALSRHYFNNEIVQNSLVISIDDLPNFGSSRHSLCYIAGASNAVLFSEPSEIAKRDISEIISSSKDREHNTLSLVTESQRILNILQEFKIPDHLSSAQLENPSQAVNYVNKVLLSYFNILWMPLISEDQIQLIHIQ